MTTALNEAIEEVSEGVLGEILAPQLKEKLVRMITRVSDEGFNRGKDAAQQEQRSLRRTW